MDRSSQENPLEHHRTPHRLDANRLTLVHEARPKCPEELLIKYFATSGLRSYSTVVKANLFQAQEKQ